jgi:hypothetical protein
MFPSARRTELQLTCLSAQQCIGHIGALLIKYRDLPSGRVITAAVFHMKYAAE